MGWSVTGCLGLHGLEPRLMLDRAPILDRHRRFRARWRAGIAVAAVEFDGPVLDMLVRLHWLLEAEVTDRDAVGHAISRMITDAARR